MKKHLAEWKTTSKLAVLPTGVVKIPTNADEISRIRHQFALTPEDQVISCVGRIGTEKNIGLLIAAFAIIARHNDRAKLLLVGTGDDLGKFQSQAADTGFAERIIFTGQIERKKLGAVYAATTVFAFPSLKDTQGLAVNEAACAGLPIVIADHEVSEVVRDGQNGYFAANSARDFAAKISHVLNDDSLQHKMSKYSLELGARVTPGKQALKLLRLYQEAIKHHRDKANPPPSKHLSV